MRLQKTDNTMKKPSNSFGPTPYRFLEVCLWIVAALAVFVLPWHIGRLQPVAGESYTFGFNNRAAVLGLGVCLALLTILKTWFYKPASSAASLAWLHKKASLFPPFAQAKGEYAVLISCSAAMFFATLYWNKILVLPYWGGELCYFLGRIDLLALGFRPYIDFQFNYGPALLYAPLWLSRASFGFLGIEDAYAWVLALSFVLGFCCVFVFLRAIQIPGSLRPLVLLLSLVMWMYISMGLHCSSLRFTITPAVLALFDRSLSFDKKVLPRWLLAGISAFFCSGICFLVSPEMGIAASMGLLAYASVAIVSKRISIGLAILGALSFCCAAMSLCFGGFLYGVFAFSSGGNNFPIYPNTTNLMLLSSALIVIPGLLSSAWIAKTDPRAALAAAIGTSALLLLPACYGRCDPGHVVINGLMILLMMFAVTAAVGRRSLYTWTSLFAVVVVLMGQISYWDHYHELFVQAFRIRDAYVANPKLIQQWEKSWADERSSSPVTDRLNWRKTAPFPTGLEDLLKSKKVGIPFGADIGIERLLKLQKEFNTTFPTSTIPGWSAPKDIERAAKECLSFDLLLIPESLIQQASHSIDLTNYQKGISEFLSGLLLYPVSSPVKNDPYLPEMDLVRTLLSTCDRVGTIPGYVLMKPKNFSN